MTQEEWLSSHDPAAMLAFLHERNETVAEPCSPRQFRLFACAVCAMLLPSGEVEQDRERELARTTAERFADGLASAEELKTVRPCSGMESGFWSVAHQDAFHAAEFSVNDEQLVGQKATMAHLLRDVVGDPFREVVIEAGWRTPDVLALASAAYQERAWDRLPILADALLDAGCTSEEILAHLREPGLHTRGCWVVDRLLRKR